MPTLPLFMFHGYSLLARIVRYLLDDHGFSKAGFSRFRYHNFGAPEPGKGHRRGGSVLAAGKLPSWLQIRSHSAGNTDIRKPSWSVGVCVGVCVCLNC